MFPAPLQRRSPAIRAAYRMVVLVALLAWLLPLGAVALTSLRSADDINRGAVWQWSAPWHFENYAMVLASSGMLRFILNSFIVTVPAVAATVLVSSMAGFALAKH